VSVLLWVGCPGTYGVQQNCPRPQLILLHRLHLESSPWARIQPCNTVLLQGRGEQGLGTLGFSTGWGDLAAVSQGKAPSVADSEEWNRTGVWALVLSWRCSDPQDSLEPTPSPGFPVQLALESCKAGLHACMHTLPHAWAELSWGLLVHVGC